MTLNIIYPSSYHFSKMKYQFLLFFLCQISSQSQPKITLILNFRRLCDSISHLHPNSTIGFYNLPFNPITMRFSFKGKPAEKPTHFHRIIGFQRVNALIHLLRGEGKWGLKNRVTNGGRCCFFHGLFRVLLCFSKLFTTWKSNFLYTENN